MRLLIHRLSSSDELPAKTHIGQRMGHSMRQRPVGSRRDELKGRAAARKGDTSVSSCGGTRATISGTGKGVSQQLQTPRDSDAPVFQSLEF